MLALAFVALAALHQATPPHLVAARSLLAGIHAADTSYTHKSSIVVWPEAGRPGECRTDCSGLWNALIPKAYPEITPDCLESWLGKKRPYAEDYFAAMKSGSGFHLRSKVGDIRPGDFIAIKYEPGLENTGHTMIVDASPAAMEPAAPTVDGTVQYCVQVIDVTNTPHGTTDSRGRETGLGRGTFRLYTNPDGTFAGHAWSLSSHSKFRPVSLRPILIGEIDPAVIAKRGTMGVLVGGLQADCTTGGQVETEHQEAAALAALRRFAEGRRPRPASGCHRGHR